MAQNRLTKVASIFTRINGLMRTKLIPESEKPMWFDIYKAFPPVRDPVYRSAANMSPKDLPPLPPRILYPEDLIRAQYFKEMYPMEVQVMSSQLRKPIWEIELQIQGVTEDKLIQATCDELQNRGFLVEERSSKNEVKVSANEVNTESNDEFMSILQQAIGETKPSSTTVPAKE